MHPDEEFFRRYEPHIADIVSRYPSPSTLYCAGRSPSTVRQALQRALRIYCSNPHYTSVIPHDTALLVSRQFVFSSNPDNTIYVGPRRLRGMTNTVTIGSEGAQPPLSIDCSDPLTLLAILHLKNYDHLLSPINISNFTLPANFTTDYPNIEIVTNPDGTHTIL